MDIALIVLGVLYLCGFHVGAGLAICAIIEGVLLMLTAILKRFSER